MKYFRKTFDGSITECEPFPVKWEFEGGTRFHGAYGFDYYDDGVLFAIIKQRGEWVAAIEGGNLWDWERVIELLSETKNDKELQNEFIGI